MESSVGHECGDACPCDGGKQEGVGSVGVAEGPFALDCWLTTCLPLTVKVALPFKPQYSFYLWDTLGRGAWDGTR